MFGLATPLDTASWCARNSCEKFLLAVS